MQLTIVFQVFRRREGVGFAVRHLSSSYGEFKARALIPEKNDSRSWFSRFRVLYLRKQPNREEYFDATLAYYDLRRDLVFTGGL